MFIPFLSYDGYSFNNKNVYTAMFDGCQSKLSSKGGIPYVQWTSPLKTPAGRLVESEMANMNICSPRTTGKKSTCVYA